jgi:uncharacterized protein YndB with AHSA1/START domain
MTQRSSNRMRVERRFGAPPERVYRALTDPDQLAEWYGPHGFHVLRSSVRLHVRPGGYWHLVMVNDANPAITAPVDYVFTEVQENSRVVAYEDARGMPGVRDGTRIVLTIELVADPDGTLVRVTQGPLPEELSRTGLVGWRQSFDRLDALLSGALAGAGGQQVS